MTQIRRATVGDSAGLARVQVDSYRMGYAGLLPEEYLEGFSYEEQELDWRAWLPAHPEDLLYVAVKDDEVVGYALGRPSQRGFGLYDGELVALHVRQLHWRQGIGRQLVVAVAGELKQLGCSSLMLWVLEGNPSRAFYERLGGRAEGKQPVILGEGVAAVEVAYGWPDIEMLGGQRAD